MDHTLVEMSCRDFVVRALRALDERDYDRLAESFDAEGVWDRMGQRLKGPSAVRAVLDQRPAAPETQHLTSNMVVDLAGDSAEVRYTICAYAQQPGAAFHLHAVLRATDRLVRRDGAWRFALRAVEPAFSAQG